LASDIHAHIIPRPIVAAAASGRSWHGISFEHSADGSLEGQGPRGAFDLPGWSGNGETIEERLERMDALRVAHHVLSVTPSLFRYELDPPMASAMAAGMNDDLAEIAQSTPTRFSALAHLPLQDPGAALRELERTAAQPGMVGVSAGTHVNGADWDAPELFPILEAIESSGQLLFLHPANRRPDPRMQRYHLKNLIGNPLETTFAVASFIFGGVIDRLPGLKVCFAHGGGFAPLGIGRFDHGYGVRAEASAGASDLPSDYLRRLYFDSITHNERTLRFLVDLVGPSQVVMGSDYPADMGVADPVGFIDGCASLSEEERLGILEGNLDRLLPHRRSDTGAPSRLTHV
jgi:aminocarboxymuconate-semialdehyde decarboxylase